MRDKEEIRKLYNLLQEDLSKEIFETDRYKEILGRCETSEEIMRNSLTKEEYSLYEDIINIYAELTDFENEESFIKGFSVANRFRDESIEK